MSTINGKSFDQIVAELQEGLPEEDICYLYDGKPYYKREAYEMRMNKVIGVLNYDFSISDPILVQNGIQQNFIVRGTIRIYDDNRNIVVEKSCAGGSDVTYKNIEDKNGEKHPGNMPVKVSNDVESACVDAFKRCCKLLGIGIMKNAKNKKSSPPQKSSSPQVSLMEVIITQRFSTFNKDALKASVEYEGKKYPFILWKEAVQAIKNECSIEKFLASYIPGKPFKFYGYIQKYNGQDQIVLHHLYIRNKDDADQKK